MGELRTRIACNKPDVIGICESWIQDDPLSSKFYPSDCLKLPGYNVYRYDNTNAIKGGILIYIKACMDGGVCKELLQNSTNFEESAWHRININDHDHMLFGCVYRKGASTEENNRNLNDTIKKACKLSDLITICGDFNFPAINWDDASCPDNWETERRFLDTLDESVLLQHNKEFTRKRGSDKPSLLDLVITDMDQTVSYPKIEHPIGKSDHAVVTWSSTFKSNIKVNEEESPRPNFFKGRYKEMRESLGKINWDECFNGCCDVNSLTTKLEEVIHEHIKDYVPMTTKKARKDGSHVPWMDFRSLRAVKKKYHSWKRYTNTRSHENYMAYIKSRNKATRKLRKAKKDFEMKIAKECSTNPKAFFNYANSHKRSTTNFIRLRVNPKSSAKDAKYTEEDQATADMLNKYFQSVFIHDIDNEALNFNNFQRTFVDPNHERPFSELRDPRDIPDDDKLSDVTISFDDVKSLLRKVNPNKSAGDDGIHPRILKECADQLAEPLCKIFRLSVDTGIVSKSWKCATVTPIFKSKDRSLPENYRPISITSQVGKLLEKIIRNAVMTHLFKNNRLSEHQHGFCNGRSCMTNLIEALDNITDMLDNGVPVDEVFLDFRKAFDKVSHERLLTKAESMGLCGNLLTWISSFLADRKQRVKVNESFSKWVDVFSGVPQGSVLGPILFLIYINDLPAMIKTNCKLFADDSKLYHGILSDKDFEALQNDLTECHNWSKQWKMEFHPDKCKVMHLGRNNKKYLYMMGNNLINVSSEEKDLGVIVCDDMSWAKQVDSCAKKAYRVIGMIKNTFTYINKEMFIVLYQTLVRPHLEYCYQVWNPYLKKDITVLEKVQRRATKIVPELHDLSYEERLRALNLYPLEERRLRGDMITVFKMVKGLMNVNSIKLLQLFHGPINTRSHDYQIQGNLNKKNVRHYFFTQRVILSWNQLSKYTVNSTSIELFKERYDKERLANYLPV